MPSRGREPPAGTKAQLPALAGCIWSKASKVMMDQQNFEAARPVSADSHLTATPGHPGSVESLARELGLKLGDQNELTIRRIKRGKSYSFVRANGTPVRHTGTIKRLHSTAVPPAYAEVRYAPDPNSHLQAVRRDAAGPLPNRYPSDLEKG